VDEGKYVVEIQDIEGRWFRSVSSDGRYIPLKFPSIDAANAYMASRTSDWISWNQTPPPMRVNQAD